MKVKLPAEQEDWLKRPAYIKNNDAGVPICENRLVFAFFFLSGFYYYDYSVVHFFFAMC